jgi:hypothetical protein
MMHTVSGMATAATSASLLVLEMMAVLAAAGAAGKMASHDVVANMGVDPAEFDVGARLPDGSAVFTPGSIALSFAKAGTIKPGTYANLHSLHAVRLPPNTHVMANAFKNCKHLTTVTMDDPASTVVSTSAFLGCPKLKGGAVKPAAVAIKHAPRHPRSAGGEALADAYR